MHMSHRTTKPIQWHVRLAKTQISLGIRPIWSVFTVCSVGSEGPNISSCGQLRLIRLGRCPGWSESSLGAKVILLVLSCGSSYHLWPFNILVKEVLKLSSDLIKKTTLPSYLPFLKLMGRSAVFKDDLKNASKLMANTATCPVFLFVFFRTWFPRSFLYPMETECLSTSRR